MTYKAAPDSIHRFDELQKQCRVLSKKLRASEEERAILEDLNDKKEMLLRNVLRDLQKSRDELAAKNQSLEEALRDVQIAENKMSTLGQSMAFIAHEINNPLQFLWGNIDPALDYIHYLLELIDLYEAKNTDLNGSKPDPAPSSAGDDDDDDEWDLDLDFVRSDLIKLISSMKHGVQRLQEVSKSLRIMARTDLDTPVKFDIHDGINSAILILKHRLKATQTRPEIHLVTDYQILPEVECFAGQLNQVFTNLLGNAIDALEESNRHRPYSDICDRPNCIAIETRLLPEQSAIAICIRDNGVGIAPNIQSRIFDRSFTTKPVGQGTGLGLALCWEIVVQRHQGAIAVESEPGQGTAFTITLPLKCPEVDLLPIAPDPPRPLHS